MRWIAPGLCRLSGEPRKKTLIDDSMMQAPQIIQRTEMRLSPWASIITKNVAFPERTEPEIYHALRQADYVNVLAVTMDGRVPLVRQYRPTLERFTVELPGGLRDSDEDPAMSATRELWEETGLRPIGELISLGALAPDAGRLENRFWGFVARVDGAATVDWRAEPGVEPLFVSKAELHELLISGRMENALHVALIGMAVFRAVFDWKS